MDNFTRLDPGTKFYPMLPDGTLGAPEYLSETVLAQDGEYTSEYSTFTLPDGTPVLVLHGDAV